MSRDVHRIDVDRVVIRGVDTTRLGARELRALIEHAVTHQLAHAPLPQARMMRTAVRCDATAPAAGGGVGLAQVVAAGVVRALSGGSRGG